MFSYLSIELENELMNEINDPNYKKDKYRTPNI